MEQEKIDALKCSHMKNVRDANCCGTRFQRIEKIYEFWQTKNRINLSDLMVETFLTSQECWFMSRFPLETVFMAYNRKLKIWVENLETIDKEEIFIVPYKPDINNSQRRHDRISTSKSPKRGGSSIRSNGMVNPPPTGGIAKSDLG